jgi:hypothetical protein
MLLLKSVVTTKPFNVLYSEVKIVYIFCSFLSDKYYIEYKEYIPVKYLSLMLI